MSTETLGTIKDEESRTSTETEGTVRDGDPGRPQRPKGLLGTGTQDVHLLFHTAPELSSLVLAVGIRSVISSRYQNG